MEQSAVSAFGAPDRQPQEKWSPSFLDLPSELRLAVYNFWIPEMTLEYGPKPCSPPECQPGLDHFRIGVAGDSCLEYWVSRNILFLCRRIRHEALHVFRTKFKQLLPVRKLAIAKNPTTLTSARIHHTVAESIETFGFRDHIDPLPDYHEFPNLQTFVVNVHQAHVSQSYHTMGDKQLLGMTSQWLNIRSWQNQVFWKLLYEDSEDKNLLVNVIGTVAVIDGYDYTEVSPAP